MISWAVETLIASSILMLVVLAVRGAVARHFGPHIAYGLWLLPALRMLLPPLPEQVTPAPLHILPSPMEIEALLMTPIPVAVADQPAIDWPLLMAIFWGGGTLLFLGWHILSYRRFVRNALDRATQLPRFDRDGIEVCASPVARGPFAAGIFLKTVVLPEDYRRRYERDELRLAIEHEVQHHRRCDMSANFVALVVLALHWWNPIAHWAHRAFRVDQELACDAVVLAAATPAERHAYGSALLKSACDRLPVAACALGAGDDLKRRLTMMKTYRWNAVRARIGSIVAAGLMGGGLLLTASNGIAAETTKKVEDKVRTALAPIAPLVAPPPAPLPPEPPAAPLAPHAPEAPPAPPAPPAPTYGGTSFAFWSDDGKGELVDGAAISREVQAEVRAAQAEARAEAAAAVREARAVVREHAAEIRMAQREAMHARPVVMAKACPENVPVMMKASDNGRVMIRCTNFQPVDQAKLRAQIIHSLEEARASVAASLNAEDVGQRTREAALAGLDRELARLRAEK